MLASTDESRDKNFELCMEIRPFSIIITDDGNSIADHNRFGIIMFNIKF